MNDYSNLLVYCTIIAMKVVKYNKLKNMYGHGIITRQREQMCLSGYTVTN